MTKRTPSLGVPLLLALLAPAAQAQNTARADQAKQLREDAAQFQRNQPLPVHQSNGDETLYPARFANYSKGLPHNALGEPSVTTYDAFVAALLAGGNTEGIPLGGDRKFVNPQAGFSFTLEGADPQAVTMVPAPTFTSDEVSGEMDELYWMSLVRDVRFDQYASNATIAQVAARLSAVREYRGARVLSTGQVTPAALFRADLPGATQGPWLSQFLLKDIPFSAGPLATLADVNPAPGVEPTGHQVIYQRYLTRPAGDDRVTAYSEWLDIQNGVSPADPVDTLPDFEVERRYIRNGRDMAEYVHADYPSNAPLVAAYLLARQTDFLNNGRYDPDGKSSPAGHDVFNPYRSYATQDPFVTFGNADAQTLVGLVSSTVLRAQWFQKWQVHRRLRPEEYGGRVHNTLTNARVYPVPSELLNSPVLPLVLARNATLNGGTGTYLLSQAFPEGSPTHPAYASGHSTYIGAGVAMLKAFYNDAPIISPSVPNATGTELVAYTGGTLMMFDELDKLASNIGVGRLFAGVHYRSDHDHAVRLGELAAYRTLQDWTRLYPETFIGFQARPFNAENSLIINPQTVLPNAVSKVLTFSLVNATSGVVIRTLVNGSLVDLSDLAAQGHTQLDIRADVAPASAVQCVRFYYDGTPFEPDNTASYEIGDTEDTNGRPFALTAGTHALRVIPFSADNAHGLTGVPLTIRFTVQN
ncbi:vanadium-dependent haloperoxidase [Pyxidicoccus sp. 3LG]